MSDVRRKKALEGILAGKPVGKAMRDAGFSKAYSLRPTVFVRGEKYLELVEQYLPEDKVLKATQELLTNEEWRARAFAVGESNKMKGRYAPTRVYTEPDPLEEMPDEELDRELKKAEAELKRRQQQGNASKDSKVAL